MHRSTWHPLAATLASLALGACAGMTDDFRMVLDGSSATLDRSMLETLPCVQEAARTTFGVVPETFGSYRDPQMAAPEYVKQRMTVKLSPSDAGADPNSVRKITYEFYTTNKGGTGVHYYVNFKGALRDEWLEQAFGPLEQCGAVRGKQK